MKYNRVRQRIFLVPYPAQGHITPMLQLAAAFHDRGLEPVVVLPDFIYDKVVNSNAQIASGDIAMASIASGLRPDETRDFFTICYAMEHNMPAHLDCMLRGSDGGRPACVVVDLLASWAIPVSMEAGVPVAGFWPAMLATYRLISAIPDLVHAGLISETGMPHKSCQALFLPGQPTLSTQDIPWLVGSPASMKSRFSFWLRVLHRSITLKWLLINSIACETTRAEEAHLTPLRCNKTPQILQVGPSIWHKDSKTAMFDEDISCMDWLDEQPISSVVYVSFGSWVAPLGDEKINELALGLEATQRPFLWALSPTWRRALPEGYLGRVAGRGKVVAWAPQKEVLKHNSIGCYLCHCGWNSTVEAIVSEKRLLCYPVAGDQFLNCRYIVGVWGIGERVNGWSRGDVVEGIRRVMEDGGVMQERVEDLKRLVVGDDARNMATSNLGAFLTGLSIVNNIDVLE